MKLMQLQVLENQLAVAILFYNSTLWVPSVIEMGHRVVGRGLVSVRATRSRALSDMENCNVKIQLKAKIWILGAYFRLRAIIDFLSSRGL